MRTQQEKILKMVSDVVEQAELEPVLDFDLTNSGVIYVQDPDSLTIFATISFNFQRGSVNIGAKSERGYIVPREGLLCTYLDSTTFNNFLVNLAVALAEELSPLGNIR